MSKYTLLGSVLIFVLLLSITVAQETTCPTLVEEALTLVSDVCSDTSRNQACYGNLTLTAEPQPNIPSFDFDSAGDKVNVADLRALYLNRLDEKVPEWGIALMKVQANLPDTLPGQNVTILLFGDVRLRATDPPPEIPITIHSDNPVNIRNGPSKNDRVITQIAPQTQLVANGRNAAGDWLHLALPEGGMGWIATFLVDTDVDIQQLDIVAEATPYYRAMQAFYLQTGIGDAACHEAPDSGVLIQTPKGTGQIQFNINEVNISLGSTAYVQAQADETMTIYVVEGQALVSAFDQTKTVPAGASVDIPLDANLAASGPPEAPTTYQSNALEALPIALLPDQIIPAEPLSEEELADLTTCWITVKNHSNARSGPGLNYPVERQLDDTQRIYKNRAIDDSGKTWYQTKAGVWLREDVVVTMQGDCAGLPILIELPPTPTPTDTIIQSESTSTTSSSASIGVDFCNVDGEIRAGTTVNVYVGSIEWPTCGEAQTALVGQHAILTVDDAPLSVAWVNDTCPGSQGGCGVCAGAYWSAISGTHTIYGAWTHGLNWPFQHTCVISVP